MRRRRTLIEDYLKAHDPLGAPLSEASAELGAPHTSPGPGAATPRRTSLRRLSLPALAAATTLAVIAAVAFMPGRASQTGSPFLTPEAAVAAASSDLEQRGILHYTMGGGAAPGANALPHIETWLDLRTHATHTVFPKRAAGRRSGGTPVRSWYNGHRTYRVDWGHAFSRRDPRKVIVRTVRRRGEPIPPAVQSSPIDELRELLAAAARGEAILKPAPAEHGVPVVRVTKRTRMDDGSLQSATTWMTREQTPRQLRTLTEFKPSKRRLRKMPPLNRRQALTFKGQMLRYDTWELLERTPENVAKVQPPAFDPKEYKVVTQFLGPPQR